MAEQTWSVFINIIILSLMSYQVGLENYTFYYDPKTEILYLCIKKHNQPSDRPATSSVLSVGRVVQLPGFSKMQHVRVHLGLINCALIHYKVLF